MGISAYLTYPVSNIAHASSDSGREPKTLRLRLSGWSCRVASTIWHRNVLPSSISVGKLSAVNLDQLRVSDGRQLDSGWRGSVDICAFGGEGVQ